MRCNRYCDYLLGVTLQATKKLAASIQPSVNGRSGMHSKPSSKGKRNEISDARRLELLLQVHCFTKRFKVLSTY